MDTNGELLRGNTPTLILAVLSEGPQHGYAIAREINRRSNATLSLRQGALYPALHALERDGLITGQWELTTNAQPDSVSQRPRKVYQITEDGREELARRARHWGTFAAAMQDVLGGALREESA